MKKNNFSIYLTSAVCLIPLIISAIFYKELPDRVAIHFNSSGVADGYAPKFIAAFCSPVLLFVINIITHFLIKKDAESKKASKAIVLLSEWTMPVVSLFLEIIMVSFALGRTFNIGSYVYLAIGIITMVIGNYLPKCQQNTTIGIKTPWTLKDKETWKKTHRLSGYIWTVGGFILCLNAFIDFEMLNIITIVTLAVVPMIYSYYIYSKKSHV